MVKEGKLVSIIIPVYNVEEYILSCLESVTEQRYKHIECIIVDDCGTDDSMSLVNGFIERYNGHIFFKIFKHDCNRGLSEARNSGIGISSGEYIFFLDSDDTITDDCIEYMMSLMNEYNSDIIICSHIESNKKVIASDVFVKRYEYNEIYLLHKIPNNAWNRLIRTEIIRANDLRFFSNIYHEDRLWSFFLVYNISSAIVSSKNTYIYNIRPNSIMTDNSKEIKRINDSLQIIKQMDSYLSAMSRIRILPRESVDYVYLERFALCVSAYSSSDHFGNEIFKASYKNVNLNVFMKLSFLNKIRCLAFLLPPKIGFSYFKFLYKACYKDNK